MNRLQKRLVGYGGTLLAGVGLGACVAQNPGVGAALAPPATRAVAAPSAYDPSGEPIVKVVQKVAPAIVSIDTSAQQTGYVRKGVFDYEEVTREVPTGQGSGVLLEGGFVLTNQHVVGDSINTGGHIRIRLADGKAYNATPVGADKQTDIALLKVDGAKNLPFATPGVDDRLLPGQQVIAIGNPVGLSASVSSGIVSALGRPLQTEGRVYENLIQTDTAINPGNSGGALIDMGGRVVGINTLVRSDAQNIGFAIPIQTAMRIADELKTSGRVQRPSLGIVARDISEFEHSGDIPAGMVVYGIYEGAPAAGLLRGMSRRSQPDLILAVNGKKTTDEKSFRDAVAGLKVGQTAQVTVWREGQTGIVKVPVVAAP